MFKIKKTVGPWIFSQVMHQKFNEKFDWSSCLEHGFFELLLWPLDEPGESFNQKEKDKANTFLSIWFFLWILLVQILLLSIYMVGIDKKKMDIYCLSKKIEFKRQSYLLLDNNINTFNNYSSNYPTCRMKDSLNFFKDN